MKILESVESKSVRKETPYFEIGDTVDVHCRIQEGEKTRTQVFTGTVRTLRCIPAVWVVT